MTKKPTTSKRLDKLEEMQSKVLEALEKMAENKSDKQSEKKQSSNQVAKSSAKEVERVNESLCKILNKTSINPSEFLEVHRFGKNTAISLMPESKGKKKYVDGTRSLYMTVTIENTRDGWDNFLAIMEDIHKKFEAHNAFYRQVKVNT